MGNTWALEKPGGVNSSHRLLLRERKPKEGVKKVVAVVAVSQLACSRPGQGGTVCQPFAAILPFSFLLSLPLLKGISRIFLSNLCCD